MGGVILLSIKHLKNTVLLKEGEYEFNYCINLLSISFYLMSFVYIMLIPLQIGGMMFCHFGVYMYVSVKKI